MVNYSKYAVYFGAAQACRPGTLLRRVRRFYTGKEKSTT